LTGLEHNGWFMLVGNDPYVAEMVRYDFARLSKDTELVMYSAEEHVMYSVAEGWKDGRKAWSAQHRSDKGTTHLRPWGVLPAEYRAIRDDPFKQQEGEDEDEPRVDYIPDVPVELARALTAFRYDRDTEGRSAPFERLAFRSLPSASKGGGFVKWLMRL